MQSLEQYFQNAIQTYKALADNYPNVKSDQTQQFQDLLKSSGDANQQNTQLQSFAEIGLWKAQELAASIGKYQTKIYYYNLRSFNLVRPPRQVRQAHCKQVRPFDKLSR